MAIPQGESRLTAGRCRWSRLRGGSVKYSYARNCSSRVPSRNRPQQIRKAQAASPPGGAGEPTAPQSIRAQLTISRRPKRAPRARPRRAEAALDRARKADAEGNASACAKAPKEAAPRQGSCTSTLGSLNRSRQPNEAQSNTKFLTSAAKLSCSDLWVPWILPSNNLLSSSFEDAKSPFLVLPQMSL